MKPEAPACPWSILFVGLLIASIECTSRKINPKVIQLKFRNDTIASPKPPVRLLPSCTSAASEDPPMVYCRNAKYPEDVLCDIGMLLESDVFAKNMVVFVADTAIADPVRPGKFCVLKFQTVDEDEAKPMQFQEINCGRDREIISEESLNVPEGIDSMTVLPQFKVASMSDIVIVSYDSGFGCKHRFKQHHEEGGGKKNTASGAFFQLDSFFCSIGFGVAEGRPETPYPPQSLYKYDGRRWRPKGIWPDYA